MSTFDGIVKEFPAIRIDCFRAHPNKSPPSACFLSHVHSDHLIGLESLKMPFVYCSATTRRLLLRMEKYSHRMNFAKGILEARRHTYKHLKHILRPLPLYTPVELELDPKNRIRVTLFDANHCPGAAMFLIQGDGKAILYTGDIRAERWWVNSIARNPMILPYITGLENLDCLYLDTTFASHDDIHKDFPTKADGLKELIDKVKDCPSNSVFYFRAWTLGYEDVWLTLSSALSSKIHVDRYQLRLFQDHTGAGTDSDPTAALGGFQLGNDVHEGCLTIEQNVQIHSCEPGLPCHVALSKNKNVVWVTPIISRMEDGTEIAEVGAGGGGGDLFRKRELELNDTAVLEVLRFLAQQWSAGPQDMERTEQSLRVAEREQDYHVAVDDIIRGMGSDVSVSEFVRALASNTSPFCDRRIATRDVSTSVNDQQRTIHFPFSRHSSYTELRYLVHTLKPRDICPCVVDVQSWTEQCSMQALFGDVCSGTNFHYDADIRDRVHATRGDERTETQTGNTQAHQDTQMTDVTELESVPRVFMSSENNRSFSPLQNGKEIAPTRISGYEARMPDTDGGAVAERQKTLADAWYTVEAYSNLTCANETISQADQTARYELLQDVPDLSMPHSEHLGDVRSSTPAMNLARRMEAFEAAASCLDHGIAEQWHNLGISSVGQMGHTEPEVEV